ncbi:MAG: glutamyl-tRNA reductase [Pseudomonadales bacterium]|nr:glutamyl-tRNA reductase [Pseudomonadales bacterium]
MAILAYGVNHRTAPLEVRERIAFPEDGLRDALHAIRAEVPTLSEAVIVSTCNRTEVYAALDPSAERQVAAWLARHRPIGEDDLARIAYTYWDADAVRHLIRVASGLDSQVLGEPQIMGQIKSAYELAREAGTLGPELHLLSQVGLATAKRVRTDTDIGRNPVSVAYAAVSMAGRLFTDLETKRALLIGAGEIMQRVAEHLHEQRVASMAIANRTLANAANLAARFNGEAMELDAVATQLHRFDIVIASTGSMLPVVHRTTVEAAIRQRRRRPIFFVDLAVPRDVEPEVGDLADVYLYTIDDLTEIIEENIRGRRAAAQTAEALVDQGTTHYLRERRAHEGQALLRQFRDGAEMLREQELQRALREIAAGVSPDQALAGLARSLTNKLIHPPTVAIRNASADGRGDLLDYLKSVYQLD